MYETHFGLRQRPFGVTSDSECYYPATTHEHALARLQQGLADHEGMVLLIGGPGAGKTLLCRRLLESYGPEAATVLLTNSHIPSRAALLQAILFDLSQPYEGKSEQELRLALTEYLLGNYQAGRPTLVVIDEAQHLQPDLLEELRLLGNLEARQGRALQVVLAGSTEILETLQQPQLAALNQRLAVRAELQALDVHESADYLVCHLRSAGGDGLMIDEALEILARGCGGVPRLLNQAGHQALTIAHAAGASHVDAEAALEALAALGLHLEEPETSHQEIFIKVADTDGESALPEETGLQGLRTDPPEEPGRTSRIYGTTRRPA